MLTERQAEELFDKLAQSPHQSFQMDTYCGVRANLMMAEAILDHGVAPEDVFLTHLITGKTRPFDTRPLPPEVFDFAVLCDRMRTNSFTHGNFSFSPKNFPDGRRYVSLADAQGRELDKASLVEGLGAVFDQHFAAGFNVEGRLKIADPSVAERILAPKEWKEASGASHGIVLAAGPSRPFFHVISGTADANVQREYYGYASSHFDSDAFDPVALEKNRAQWVTMLAPFRAYQEWKAQPSIAKLGINPRLSARPATLAT